AEQTQHELLAIESERGRLLRKEYTTYLEIHHE
ncbi:MAG: tRNA 2-thiouridine synthesizing protein A, partial [Natronomonas sp.]